MFCHATNSQGKHIDLMTSLFSPKVPRPPGCGDLVFKLCQLKVCLWIWCQEVFSIPSWGWKREAQVSSTLGGVTNSVSLSPPSVPPSACILYLHGIAIVSVLVFAPIDGQLTSA